MVLIVAMKLAIASHISGCNHFDCFKTAKRPCLIVAMKVLPYSSHISGGNHFDCVEDSKETMALIVAMKLAIFIFWLKLLVF